MYRSFFPRDVFAEMDRLQREMQQAFDLSPSIRGFGRNGFPALNVGSTPQSFEIFAFAPGVKPESLEIHIERGVVTIAGERRKGVQEGDAKTALHIDERFEGRFHRVLTLPEDADPDQVTAALKNGVLHLSVKRRASAQPRRIAVQ